MKLSDDLFLRAQELTPTMAHVESRGQLLQGVAPKYLQRGKGCLVWDVDGNEYIDLNMADGAISLGYCYKSVDEAILAQLNEGTTFSLMHPLELEVAEMIHELVPGAEGVRFRKSGSDTRSAAIGVSRAYTKRSKVLWCGSNCLRARCMSVIPHPDAPIANGPLIHTFDYNDLNSLETFVDQSVACVILEAVAFEAPHNEFLQRLRELCSKKGVLLIFDETWSGFRIALGGAQQHFGVTADLACFSKALANGMPLSVITGRREIIQMMEEDVSLLTTSGNEALSLAAAEATLHELREKSVPQHIAQLNRLLRESYNRIAEELHIPYTRCIGLDFRTRITFDPSAGDPLKMKLLMQRELLRHGVLWNGFHNLSLSHQQDDVIRILSVYAQALSVLKHSEQKGDVAH